MSKRWVAVLTAAVLLGGAAIWQFGAADMARAKVRLAPSPAVPVRTVAAAVRDVPVYLRGLGTVQALNVVEIKAQVSGTLIAIPVKEGQEVKSGDIVAQIDPRPYQAALDQALAQRAGDQAQLKSARLDLQRYQSLAKQSFAPVQQVDEQQATVDKLAAAVQADTAAIETAQLNLGYCVIRAPVDGRVSLYQTDPGNLIEVASQTGIVSITQDHPISLVFTLPEANLPRIQDAMAKGTLPVTAFSSDDTTQLGQGSLLTPDNAIDTTTGTIALKAIFPNDNNLMWPGEFVNARLRIDTLRHAVTLPQLAIQHGPDGLYVYKLMPDSTVQQQTVTVGYDDGTTAVVTKGLNGNEQVVLDGQSRLSPGARVAMAANDDGGPTNNNAGEAGASGGITKAISDKG